MTAVNYDKIKGLVYTEKSNKILESGKYCLEVDKSCTKSEVKTLVKSVFGVDAEKVNIINTAGKVKRFKGIIGTRKAYKKAIITVKKGQTINFQELK
jgi:large subunit ribosomal protein L23